MDTYHGNDEESAELRKALAEVEDDIDNFETWEKLVRVAEGLEGGINRNSSSQAITSVRNVYDRFLGKFPLFFGYWKKYADLEFSIAGTEAAELVYERGVSSITNSVDLWTNYCSFKTETSHDAEVIRELFERGANFVGLDFLAHPFWDKYIEFEERMEQKDRIFSLLGRIINIPMHQYARYFQKYQEMARSRPLSVICAPNALNKIQLDLENEGAGYKSGRNQAEVEHDLRTRVESHHLAVFQHTQSETTKRWTYESEIKRPYFHVTDLDESQLVNWRKYLDYEESEGSFVRIQFLYERCLVTCAQHEEFWLRYARWMLAQPGKDEEVRNVYQRASYLFVPIALPAVRLQYAYFEEMCGRPDVAKDIHEAILVQLPSSVETIVSWANTCRRQGSLDDAVAVYQSQLGSADCNTTAKAAVVAELARFVWKVKGSASEAREIFQKHQSHYLDSGAFWTSFLAFEIEQPSNTESEKGQHAQIKKVIDDIFNKTKLPSVVVQELMGTYMVHLLTRGTKEAAREYMELDREINGPTSVQKLLKGRSGEALAGKGLVNGQTRR